MPQAQRRGCKILDRTEQTNLVGPLRTPTDMQLYALQCCQILLLHHAVAFFSQDLARCRRRPVAPDTCAQGGLEHRAGLHAVRIPWGGADRGKRKGGAKRGRTTRRPTERTLEGIPEEIPDQVRDPAGQHGTSRRRSWRQRRPEPTPSTMPRRRRRRTRP